MYESEMSSIPVLYFWRSFVGNEKWCDIFMNFEGFVDELLEECHKNNFFITNIKH